jgi:pentatricopeptide repeat protein
MSSNRNASSPSLMGKQGGKVAASMERASGTVCDELTDAPCVSRSSPKKDNANPNQPKLRRKAPLQDTLNELTAVQRLVEYFVVVSSRARWSKEAATNSRPSNPPVKKSLLRGRKKHTEELDDQSWDYTAFTTSSGANSSTENGSSYDGGLTGYRPLEPPTGNIHMPQTAQEHSFEPKITARYPLIDHEDNPLNPMILQFCYPSGEVIEPTTDYSMPRVHHFVLTNEKGRKLYGTCLTILEEYVPSNINDPWLLQQRTNTTTRTEHNGVEVFSNCTSEKKPAFYLPKVLCILSTWPYLTAFREYLAQFYRLATTTNLMTAPIERFVVNLVSEIPAPPPGAYEVQVSILNSTIRFWAPPAKLPIAFVALPFQILFECLDLDNVLKVWSAVMVERKVILLSSQYSILTVCAEILCSLLFPLRWSHLFVPLLPRMLCPILDAPVPYLVGLVRENWLHAQQYVSRDAIVVDLDRNTVKFGELVQPIPALPQKKYGKLAMTLTESVGHVFWRARGLEKEYQSMLLKKPSKRVLPSLSSSGNQWNEKLESLDHAFNLAYTPDSPNLLNDTLSDDEQNMWAKVQEGFLRFFVALFKGYGKYLCMPDITDGVPAGRPTFDLVGFCSTQKAERAEFLVDVCMTQQFDDFLTRRMYSPGEPDLVFFDQSISAKKNRSKLKFRKAETPLLRSAKIHKELLKIKAVEPNDDLLSIHDCERGDKRFVYKRFPDEFSPHLFSDPRPIPKMIAAEFDRQSLLVEKLRASTMRDQASDDILEFYGGDYDPSPEVASFTVFFYVYSAIVGGEWQEYKKQCRDEINSVHLPLQQDSDLTDDLPPLDQFVEVTDQEIEAVNSMLADLSMGTCDDFPSESLLTLKSVMIFCEDGAQGVYGSMLRNSVERVAEIQTRLSPIYTISKDADGKHMTDDVAHEEARLVASAQLDLAFEALAVMEMRGLSVDSDAYLSLMEACGRCGDTRRALHLIELMRQDGFVADKEVLSCFMAAFANSGTIARGTSTSAPQNKSAKDSDAYSNYLKKKLDAINDRADEKAISAEELVLSSWKPTSFSDASSDGEGLTASESSWSVKTPAGWFAIANGPNTKSNPPLKKERRNRHKRSFARSSTIMHVTDMIERQLTLGESLIDFLYPQLVIDTNSDSCPQCSNTLTESEIVTGWRPSAFQDYTTECPKCSHRFVPRFVVSCSAQSFEGSQGRGTPLYCEFLSPWVVRRGLQHYIKSEGSVGIDAMLDPAWRSGTDIQATLFWNIMVLCRRYRLPFSFMLHGSFRQNRLVLPRTPADM